MPSDDCLKDLNVLIVEDDPDSGDLYAFIFKSVGANVKVAVSANEALQMLEKFNPDIVISDITLPDGDGCSLINHIKEILKAQGKKLKGLAVTGITSDEDKVKFKIAGFEQYLSKPIGPDNLVKVVADLTDKDCN